MNIARLLSWFPEPAVDAKGLGTYEQSATRLARDVGLVALLMTYTIIYLFNPTAVLRDPDTLWHVRTGRWIVEHGQWPTTDMFSYTFYGQPWIAKEWLSQLLLNAAYQLGGWPGVVFLAIATCAAVAGIVTFYLARILRFSVAVGLAWVTFFLMSGHFLARPHIFGYLLMALWLFALLEAWDHRRSPPFWLAALMLLWANTHSTFVLGLIFFYIVSGAIFLRAVADSDRLRTRRTVLVVLAVSAAAVITPYGFSSIWITWKMMGMEVMLANLIEWQPPDFRASPIYMVYLLAFILLLAASGTRLCLPRLAILFVAGWIGFSYVRGFMVFILVVPFLLARPLAQQLAFAGARNPQREKSDPVLCWVFHQGRNLVVVCLAVAFAATFVSPRLHDFDPSTVRAPRAAIDYVRKAGISGPLFNSYDFGGYLIFAGIHTFIDGRAELFSEDFLKAYFNAVDLADIRESHQLLNCYEIAWILLRPGEPLAKALLTSDAWKTAYADKNAVVFVRAQ